MSRLRQAQDLRAADLEPQVRTTRLTRHRAFFDRCGDDGFPFSQESPQVQSHPYRSAATIPIKHEEIIEDIEGQVRRCGGAWGEWCAGTAKDSRGPFFLRHLAADLGDGLAYREAYTSTAAQAVVYHLVNNRGLQLDQESERRSALHPAEARQLSSCPGDSVVKSI